MKRAQHKTCSTGILSSQSSSNLQLSLVIATEASNEEEEKLVAAAYEALIKLGTDSRYGLSQASQAHADGSYLCITFSVSLCYLHCLAAVEVTVILRHRKYTTYNRDKLQFAASRTSHWLGISLFREKGGRTEDCE